jgi:hypothetical protein
MVTWTRIITLPPLFCSSPLLSWPPTHSGHPQLEDSVDPSLAEGDGNHE